MKIMKSVTPQLLPVLTGVMVTAACAYFFAPKLVSEAPRSTAGTGASARDAGPPINQRDDISGTATSGPGDVGGRGIDNPPVDSNSHGIKILSKPKPGYTDDARENNVEGTVILRVTFLANGEIGAISPTKGLSNGLTERAMDAAKRIQFEPAMSNGTPVTVTKQIEYTFSIY